MSGQTLFENAVKYYQLSFPQNAMNLYDAYDLLLIIRSGNLVKQYTLNERARTIYKFNKDSGKYQSFTDKHLTHKHIKDTFLINITDLVYLQNGVLSYCLYNVDSNKLTIQYPIVQGAYVNLSNAFDNIIPDNDFILKPDPLPKQKKFMDFYANIKSTYLKNQKLKIEISGKYSNSDQLSSITDLCFGQFSENNRFKIVNGELIAPSTLIQNKNIDILTISYKINDDFIFNKKFNLQVVQDEKQNFLSGNFDKNEDPEEPVIICGAAIDLKLNGVNSLNDLIDYQNVFSVSNNINEELQSSKIIIQPWKLESYIGKFQVFLTYKDNVYNITNDKNLKILTSNNESILSFEKNYDSLSGTYKIAELTKKVSIDIWFQYQKDDILFTSNKKTLVIDPLNKPNEYNNAKYAVSLTGDLISSNQKYLTSSAIIGFMNFNSQQKNFYSSMLNNVKVDPEDCQKINVQVFQIQKDFENGNELYSNTFIDNPEDYYDCVIYAKTNLYPEYDNVLTAKIPYTYYFRKGLNYKVEYRDLASNQKAYKIKEIIFDVNKPLTSCYIVGFSNLNIVNLKQNYQILSITGIFKRTDNIQLFQKSFIFNKDFNVWAINGTSNFKTCELKQIKISIAYIPNEQDFNTIEILKNM